MPTLCIYTGSGDGPAFLRCHGHIGLETPRIGCFLEAEACMLVYWCPPIPHQNIIKVVLLTNNNIVILNHKTFVELACWHAMRLVDFIHVCVCLYMKASVCAIMNGTHIGLKRVSRSHYFTQNPS
jgi:hypothetical protein